RRLCRGARVNSPGRPRWTPGRTRRWPVSSRCAPSGRLRTRWRWPPAAGPAACPWRWPGSSATARTRVPRPATAWSMSLLRAERYRGAQVPGGGLTTSNRSPESAPTRSPPVIMSRLRGCSLSALPPVLAISGRHPALRSWRPPERARPLPGLEHDGLDVGEVRGGGDQVLEEAAGEVPALVDHDLLQQRHPEALSGSAAYLP